MSTASFDVLDVTAAGDRYTLHLEQVCEVVRPLELTPLPGATAALEGLGTLRGTVLPVASLAACLGRERTEASDTARLVVVDAGERVGLAVDAVLGVRTVAAEDLQEPPPGTGAVAWIEGLTRTGNGAPATLLDAAGMLPAVLPRRGSGRAAHATTAVPAAEGSEHEAPDERELVRFECAGRDIAVDVAAVREIVRAPAAGGAPPGLDGVCALADVRGVLVPVVSLAELLGEQQPSATARSRVLVLVPAGGGAPVGLLVDDTRSVFRVPAGTIQAAPGTGGPIEGLCRPDGAAAPCAVLDLDRLLAPTGLWAPTEGDAAVTGSESAPVAAADGAEEQFVVFRASTGRYGLAVEDIREIVRTPEAFVPVPGLPAFFAGLMNLRGEVLGVVDLTARLGGGGRPARSAAARVVVLDAHGHRVGLLVDAVEAIHKAARGDVQAAPAGSADQAVTGVLDVAGSSGIVLVLDPRPLLDTEALDALGRSVRTEPAA